MPQRTTPFQAIVHLVRSHYAQPGVTVTESGLLWDPVGQTNREVDIVISGLFDGEPIVISIEIIERGRPADITWVEGMIAKHANLKTNRLVLVSQSGFYKPALRLVAAQNNRVQALQPKIVIKDDEVQVETMHASLVQLNPTSYRVKATHPDGQPVAIDIEADLAVYNAQGEELGGVFQMAKETLGLNWLMKRFMMDALDHPGREQKGFSCGFEIGGLGYFLINDSTKQLHHLLALHIAGEFQFTQTEMRFTSTLLADLEYGAGSGELFGRPGVWVKTKASNSDRETVTWRPMDAEGKETAEGVPRLWFPGLLTIPTYEGDLGFDDIEGKSGQ